MTGSTHHNWVLIRRNLSLVFNIIGSNNPAGSVILDPGTLLTVQGVYLKHGAIYHHYSVLVGGRLYECPPTRVSDRIFSEYWKLISRNT